MSPTAAITRARVEALAGPLLPGTAAAATARSAATTNKTNPFRRTARRYSARPWAVNRPEVALSCWRPHVLASAEVIEMLRRFPRVYRRHVPDSGIPVPLSGTPFRRIGPRERRLHSASMASKNKFPKKVYEREIPGLQEDLVRMEDWVAASGARIVVIFEGRDAAGKGGTIKRITDY